jgi:RNA polymerase sigma-70 factor (ECF subfamily)
MRAVDPDVDLLARVRSGDETAFVVLVNRYHGSMLRVARSYVPSEAIAEEAVQETWMGVVRGIERFEGRSSFKTWLFRILINRARTAGGREHRDVPLADVEPAVDPSRFTSGGAWAEPLGSWETDVDNRLVAATWTEALRSALDDLPPRQREVVVLRDVEGLTGEDVCTVLGVTEGNQRVLLHRGRSRLRTLLEYELTVRGR